MTEPRHTSAIKAALHVSFAGAVVAGCALGLAAQASADDNCDPLLLSMTPQPVLACEPDAAPPPVEPPAAAPVNDAFTPPPPVDGPPPAEELPVPPVG